MPSYLEEYLNAYIEGAQIARDRKGYLFRSALSKTGLIGENRMTQVDVYPMIRRRATRAGIETRIGCHTFRATGITEYYATAENSKWRSRWRIMNRRERRACMIGQ